MLLLFASLALQAQIVGTEAYIKGPLVEIGIDGSGGFEGASTGAAPPLPGMHQRGSPSLFGFVANPQVNNWVTFDGDFYTPGSPENGWGFVIGDGGTIPSSVTTGACNASNNSSGFTSDGIPGSITNFGVTGECTNVAYTGTITTCTNLTWKIDYQLQDSNLFYTTTVSVTNNTSAPITDLYYYRSFDPDNNQSIGGDFTTSNTIVSQPNVGCTGGGGIAHVSATSTNPSSQPMSYVGLAGAGPNFRVTHGDFSVRNGYCVWNGLGGLASTVGATSFSDAAISLAYKIPNLAAGATETFKFVVILDDDAALEAINDLIYFSYPGAASTPPSPCSSEPDTVNTCGAPVNISVNGSIVSDFTWTWSPSTGLSSTTGPSVTANPGVTTSYVATGTPTAGSCLPAGTSVTLNVVVNVTPPGGVNPYISPVPVQCISNPPFNLTVDSMGGTWSGTGITDPSLGTFSPAAAGPGTYMISYSTSAECNSTDTIMITVNAADATINQPPIICADDPVYTMSSVSTGGVWSGSGITDTLAGTFDPAAVGAGTYIISYTLSGACFSVDTVQVTVGAVIVPNTVFNYPDTLCKQTGPTMPTPGTSFTSGGTWSSTPAGLSLNTSSGEITPATSTAGTYYVTYYVAATVCGPAGSTVDTVYIQPIFNPIVTFTYPPSCASDSAMFPTVPPTFTWGGVWSISDGLTIDDSSGVILVGTAPAPGTYTVTYTVAAVPSLCAAFNSSTFPAVINALPSIMITPEQLMWIGDTVPLFATGGDSYIWTPSLGLTCPTCDTTLAGNTETTTYCAHVTNSNGCIDSACVKVNIEIPCPSNRNLTIPNAFTPNRDGINDEFCLDGWDDCVTNFEIKIYDRWGEKVFESTNPAFCWDGYYKGRLLDPAVFVYFIRASYMKAGETITDPQTQFDVKKNGNISLVR